MKNIKTILFGLAVLSMAACTQEKLDAPNADQELVEVTIEAGIDNGVDSKVVYTDNDAVVPTMTWKDEGEKFTIILGNGGGKHTLEQQSAPSEGKAVFSGNLPAIDNFRGSAVVAIYPTVPDATTMLSHIIDISSQTGKYDEKNTHMYWKYSDQYKNFLVDNKVTADVTFGYLVSILKVTLDFGDEVGTATDVTFSADNLITLSKIAPNTGVWNHTSDVVGKSVTFSKSFDLVDGKATVYLYMLPGTVTDLKVSAIVNYKSYKATVRTGAKEIKQGKMYDAKTVDMVTDDVDVTSLTVMHLTEGYSYDGLDVQVGKKGSASAVATGTFVDGKAILSENHGLVANDEIWVCIPKVAKFFHKLTQGELDANIINLPDKNNGSTLLAEPTIAGKPYVNDWIVALYIGIDTDNGDPLYWATGNLIAIKTNDAGSATVAAYFVATKEISEAEATSDNPYRLWPVDAVDGFVDSPAGTAWDVFQAATTNGARRATNNSHVGNGTWSSDMWHYSGKFEIDICTCHLGGSWRLPTYPTSDSGEAYNYMVKGGSPGINVPQYSVSYTTPDGIIKNTISLPGAGGYLGNNQTSSVRKSRPLYMTGDMLDGSHFRVLDSYAKTTSFEHKNCTAVRPVTE